MISAFHVSYKTVSKASLLEKAAKKGMRGQLVDQKKKQRETDTW